MKNEERNYLTDENGAKIIQVTSEMTGCGVSNILFNETKAIWLSEEGIPQEIIIDISTLISKPSSVKAFGVYCWHAYPTNPKLIEIFYSSNNKNYNTLGHFDLCIKSGIQVFDLDDLSLKSINFLKIIIKETFGGKRTYLNNVYMYENIPHNDIIISVRESRERNMPRPMPNTTTASNTNTLKKELLTREFADDLLDMKSKDDSSNLFTQKNIATNNNNILSSSDNQMLISDSDLSEKIVNPKTKEQDQFTSRILEEEDEEKEKSSIYGSLQKQSQFGNEMKIVANKFHESSVALENEEMDLQLRESNTSYNRINTTNDIKQDYHHIESEFNCKTIINNPYKQKELYKSSDTNNQLESVQLNNPNLLSNYINTITNSIDDVRENTEGNYQNNNFQSYQNDKYIQIDIRLSSLEKDVGTIKDQLVRISQNIETIVEAQNNLNESTYGYILDECKQMIDLRIGNALTNLNLYKSDSNHHHHNSNSNSNKHNFVPSSSSGRKKQVYQINRNVANISYERNDSKNRRNTSYNEMSNQSSFIDQQPQKIHGEEPKLTFLEKNLDNQLEEKFIDFSNQLGQKITETLLKPSITQLENFMKGNLSEMKMHLKNAGRKNKTHKHQHQHESKTLKKEQQLTALLDKLQVKLDVEEKKEYHNLPLKMNNNHYIQYSNNKQNDNNNSQSNKNGSITSSNHKQLSENTINHYLP